MEFDWAALYNLYNYHVGLFNNTLYHAYRYIVFSFSWDWDPPALNVADGTEPKCQSLIERWCIIERVQLHQPWDRGVARIFSGGGGPPARLNFYWCLFCWKFNLYWYKFGRGRAPFTPPPPPGYTPNGIFMYINARTWLCASERYKSTLYRLHTKFSWSVRTNWTRFIVANEAFCIIGHSLQKLE